MEETPGRFLITLSLPSALPGITVGNFNIRGPGTVVGIAIAYGLDGPGIESRLGEIFRTSPDRP